MNRREASPTNQRKFRRLDRIFRACPLNERECQPWGFGRGGLRPISLHYRRSHRRGQARRFLMASRRNAPQRESDCDSLRKAKARQIMYCE